jgi:hypothetical protein
MSDIARNVILIPLAVLFYASGLLLWPIRRWLCRKRSIRGKSLGFVFLGQLVSYAGTIIVAAIWPRILEHGYYWFIILIELNILFTIAGVIAWIRDSLYERKLDTNVVTKSL